ncbi:VOC family protein [Streptomyces albireticuli]|uniref:VOC family protein n=1 Tax=Streptomyces albireticuli TaxID=1940 RepID=UPI001E445B78|nr:VOC family protein [Streptomyces albireticuli]MCD9142894.1 VOC family protein [Streptomyces albireticuli]MCD9162787.1 VOC family protein [Streptomyces albireticuli]MCD9192347.1 VOC family protein [Streptomyces albireticuli]
MPNELNHIIVHVKDRRETGAFLAWLAGSSEAPLDWGPFTQVTSSNGVGVDFADDLVPAENINFSHLAFLVTDGEFDAVLARIAERELPFWADPLLAEEGKINHDYGGRGVYVRDPGGTCVIEFITTPYGEQPSERSQRATPEATAAAHGGGTGG